MSLAGKFRLQRLFCTRCSDFRVLEIKFSSWETVDCVLGGLSYLPFR